MPHAATVDSVIKKVKATAVKATAVKATADEGVAFAAELIRVPTVTRKAAMS